MGDRDSQESNSTLIGKAENLFVRSVFNSFEVASRRVSTASPPLLNHSLAGLQEVDPDRTSQLH